MAKIINPIIRLQGSFQNMVFVKSNSYGDHVRAARGSVNNASVNDHLQANADRTSAINNTAKRVHDLLKMYAADFKESLLWQQLLSRMRRSPSNNPEKLLSALNGLELNRRYPLTGFGTIPVADINIKQKQLLLTLSCNSKTAFKKNINCYYYEVCILFFGNNTANDRYVTMQTGWIKVVDQPQAWLFEFDIPSRTIYWLACLKLQGGLNEIESVGWSNKGIAVMAGGKL